MNCTPKSGHTRAHFFYLNFLGPCNNAPFWAMFFSSYRQLLLRIFLIHDYTFFQKNEKKSRKDGVRSTYERIMVFQSFPLRSNSFQTTLRDL